MPARSVEAALTGKARPLPSGQRQKRDILLIKEAAGVIKDGKLSFIDREGNQLVEPVDVDYDEDFRFQLEYLEGPEVYDGRYGDTMNYNYFDLEGWIWKP